MSRIRLLTLFLPASGFLACQVEPLPQRIQCGKSCTGDADCELGLVCFDSTSRGPICLPQGCATCVGSTSSCTTTSETKSNGDISCGFVECTSAAPNANDASAAGSCSQVGEAGAVCVNRVATGSPKLIDDFSHVDIALPANDGRSGNWYIYNDGTVGATQTPSPYNSTTCTGGPIPIDGQMCTSGSGFSTWGTGTGVNLNSGGSLQPCPYDVSMFTGISFSISGYVTSGYMRFQVTTSATTPTEYGGTCTSTAGGANGCDDHYSIAFVPHTSSPVAMNVPFSLLAQEGWGATAKWNPKEVLAIQWQEMVDSNNLFGQATPVDYSNICVDNVTFF